MNKTYVEEPSSNFAVREKQITDYHPKLCYGMGQTHAAYGWAPFANREWDEAQKAAYNQGYDDYKGDKNHWYKIQKSR